MDPSSIKQYIRYIELDRERVPSFSEYPFNLAVIKNLHRLSFHPQVTFIIGENGSGKLSKAPKGPGMASFYERKVFIILPQI